MLSIAERHKYILDSLNRRGFVRITDVANELGVTKVTIRKDVKILESKGLLYKVHGSARPANPHVADLDVHVKDNINREAKRAIARRAVELLDDNDSVIVASGSTIHAFAEEIRLRPWHHLNIVTPFLRLGVLLNEVENVDVVQLGGAVHKKSLSVSGSEAVRALDDCICSKVFFGVDGIDLEHGITKEFQTFIAACLIPMLFVCVGTVSQGVSQKSWILELVTDHFLKFFKFFFHD